VVARGLLMIASRRVIGGQLDRSLLLILGGAVAGVLINRLAAPGVGEIPAAAGSCAIALAIAFLVLVRTGDVAVLVSEFRRG
jgi:hypothetical protein